MDYCGLLDGVVSRFDFEIMKEGAYDYVDMEIE